MKSARVIRMAWAVIDKEGENMKGNIVHNLAAVLAMFGAGFEGMAVELA